MRSCAGCFDFCFRLATAHPQLFDADAALLRCALGRDKLCAMVRRTFALIVGLTVAIAIGCGAKDTGDGDLGFDGFGGAVDDVLERDVDRDLGRAVMRTLL